MELRQLNYFVKAAETLHFTEAAEAVFITQSTLSQQIKQLEEELGVLLFDRIGKQVRLTEAGNVFLIHARQVLLEVQKGKQAIAELNNMVTGELRIGVTYAFTSLLIPALLPFSEKYPGIKLYIEYGTPEELDRKLHLSQLDLVLAFHDPADNAGLVMQPLLTSTITLVVSKKHPMAQLKKISLKELGRIELILPGKGFSSRDFLDEIFRKQKITPNIRIELNDVHSLLSLVEEGNWATILNEKALIGWKTLVSIPITGRELKRQSFILWQKGAYRKKSAIQFIDELMKAMAKS
jgi:LysR family cyn operon transcriptional activator